VTEDEYLDIVTRIQQAMVIVPFCPDATDVVILIGAWRDHEREIARLMAALRDSVDLDEVRKAWQNWKQAWGTGDSEEALALMEMDGLLGVDEQGNVV
jgi:hypothetical protein